MQVRAIRIFGLVFVMICLASSLIMAQGISIDLGKTETGRYMNLVGNTGDGEISNTFIDPEYCAENVGTTMYFTIDDTYMSQRETGQFTMINVEYYDAAGVEIQLVYDAIGDPGKPYPLTIVTQGTNSWKSFNFFVDDAYFGNGMTNSADLSLVALSGTMSINAVKVIAIDAYIDFNGTSGTPPISENDEYYITQVEFLGGDTKVDFITIEGESTTFGIQNNQYLYCDLDDSFAYNGSNPYMFIAVEYYDDDALMRMRLQYDSFVDDYDSTPWVEGKAWNSFRTHTFEISDALFAGREHSNSDFRIHMETPDIKVNRAMVAILDAEPLPTTGDLPSMSAYEALEAPTIDGDLVDWDWLNDMHIDPDTSNGKRTDEYYRTWLLNNDNTPIAETGEVGINPPDELGQWDLADLGGGLRVLWDADNLYIALSVSDNEHDVDGTGWKEQDGFGIFMDVSHTYVTGADGSEEAFPIRDDLSFQQGEHFIFLPATESELGTWVHSGMEAGEALPTEVVKSVVVADTGYVMEVSIPLDLLRDELVWTPNDESKDDFNPLFGFVLNDADNLGAESGRLMYGAHSADDEFWGRLNFQGIPLVDRGLTIDFGDVNYEQLVTHTQNTGDGLIDIVVIGGKKCARLSNGYLYLDLDNDVFGNVPHPHVLISVEYFDAAIDSFRIQYDALDDDYKDTEYILVGNTQAWKTAIIEIEDASFTGGQSGGADFRIHSPNNNLHLNQVRVAIADLWIDLGVDSTMTWFGIREGNLASDGTRAVAFVGGVDCKRSTQPDPNAGGRYFYHNVDDTIIYRGEIVATGAAPELFLTVEYYDTTSSNGISLNYDGMFDSWSDGDGNAFISGSNQWKLHTWYLPDAGFGNRENGGTDFRAGGQGDDYTYINRILIGSLTALFEPLGINELATPFAFKLDQNYPNPFNPTTVIEYEVARSEKVTLKIYNVLGQEVRSLVDADHAPGRYTVRWDGKDASGIKVPSGLYIYRYSAGDHVKSHKMTLIK